MSKKSKSLKISPNQELVSPYNVEEEMKVPDTESNLAFNQRLKIEQSQLDQAKDRQ